MDIEFHNKIVRELCKYIDIDEDSIDVLCAAATEPDQEYERAIASLQKEAEEKTRMSADHFDSVQRSGFWDGVRIWLNKWGKISSIQLGNLFDQAMQYTSWAIEHGPRSIQNCIECYSKAKAASQKKDLLRELGYASHFAVDTGTPYHRKDLEEIADMPQNVPEDEVGKTLIINSLHFARSAVLDHQVYEKELSNYWFYGPEESHFNTLVNQGFENALLLMKQERNGYLKLLSKRLENLCSLATQKLVELDGIRKNERNVNDAWCIAVRRVGNECLPYIAEVVGLILINQFKLKFET